jgi:hypothetical protein
LLLRSFFSWILSLIRCIDCKYFLPLWKLSLHSVDYFLGCAKAF